MVKIIAYMVLALSLVPRDTNDVGNTNIECYTKQGYFVAISEEYLDNMVRYSVDKDYAALQKLLDAGVVFQMKENVKVYIVDTHLFSGTIEFRIPGYTQVLWSVREAIRC